MKNSAVQIVSLVFGNVLAVAMQDLAPAFAGVKPPFVVAVTLFTAFHAPLALALPAAFVAGLFTDALAGVPAFCATSLLPLLTLGAHFLRTGMTAPPSAAIGMCVTAAAAALGETWLAVCGFADADTGLLVRVCAAGVAAAPVGAMLFALLPPLGRKIGLEVEP